MTWPGRDADQWWDGLPVERKEQVHRWITQRKNSPQEDLPAGQLALDERTLAPPGA